ncbi:hypothetical protein [Rhodococcus sp. NPDC057529]|uniref:hypothetical protein n=1 Tax=Rhodococcus sp. NPDC057529 TaxID=3346158 RepID=UPI00366D55A8
MDQAILHRIVEDSGEHPVGGEDDRCTALGIEVGDPSRYLGESDLTNLSWSTAAAPAPAPAPATRFRGNGIHSASCAGALSVELVRSEVADRQAISGWRNVRTTADVEVSLIREGFRREERQPLTCSTDLYADRGEEYLSCPHCWTHHRVADLDRAILKHIDDQISTMPELVLGLRAMREPVPIGTLYPWHSRSDPPGRRRIARSRRSGFTGTPLRCFA